MSSSMRLYVVRDEAGLLMGQLIARAPEDRAPSAVAETEEGLLAALEVELARLGRGSDLAWLLWNEPFQMGKVVVEIRPEAFVQKRRVIGRERIQLELSYAWTRLQSGSSAGYQVFLPRFGWSLLLEDLSIAADVLRQTVSGALTGESPRSLFEFREYAAEYVLDWAPKLLRKRGRSQAAQEPEFPVLDQVAEDWTTLTRRGRLGTLLGELDPATHERFLRSQRLPSILLVGPPGVGKTSWVRELARRTAQSGASATRVWATSSDRLLAGMKYLGMWEQRCLEIVSELSGEGHFLYVDRLGPFVQPRTALSSLADLFLPAVRGGEISLIAEATPAELERAELTAPGLVGAFEVVRLTELSPELTVARMLDYQALKNPRLQLHPDAARRLIRHLALYRKETAFPGKAFLFIDWLNQHSTFATRSSTRAAVAGAPSEPSEEPTRVLELQSVDRVFAHYSGLSARLISDEYLGHADLIATELSGSVVGQDTACRICANVVTRFKAGLNDPEKPLGTLLFAGPTGVGKTELAKQLARVLFGSAERMVRLDMSEYHLPWSAERLLSDETNSSSLAQRVSQQPLCLVLFDEIEKAHPAVFDVLLGVLGEGRLTTTSGRPVDFRMSLLVMTSNLGSAGQGAGQAVGFGRAEGDARDALKAVRDHFRPEFFNRLDHVVPFAPLGASALSRIVKLELDKIARREGLRRRQLSLQVSAAAEARLAELGYDPRFGARPLTRVLEERVVTPIAVQLARRPNLNGARVLIEERGGEIEVSFAQP